MIPGIGLPEIIIVLVIVLVIFGPKRLPDLGRSLGSGMREFKDSVTGNKKKEDDELPAGGNTEPVRSENAEPVRSENTEPARSENAEPARSENAEPVGTERAEAVRAEKSDPTPAGGQGS